MQEFFQFINTFVYLYPLVMSLVWMIGGLIFARRLEHGRRQDPPKMENPPHVSILVPCHNEEGQIRETFGYAYLAKMWLGQKDIRVYMVGLQEISEHLNPLIELFRPYIDGVFSLCGTPYLDDLIQEAKRLYSE